ncbi:hypothetical protein AB9K35_01115 [Leisingera sp. XS_AS12]|uniref:hypothetical protein n=1 Tax=Leisingera sp. XS_AS12 TaxID=3241294 RepID=UPI003516120C
MEPVFIDFEASSLAPKSWPIEVGIAWVEFAAEAKLRDQGKQRMRHASVMMSKENLIIWPKPQPRRDRRPLFSVQSPG